VVSVEYDGNYKPPQSRDTICNLSCDSQAGGIQNRSANNSPTTFLNWPVDWLSDWLTPWSRVLPDKLVKKFPTFYGNRRFITAFTTVPILRQVDPVRAPSHFLKMHFNIILSSTPLSQSGLLAFVYKVRNVHFCVRFKDSAVAYFRSSLFRDLTWYTLVAGYRRVETTYRSNLQGTDGLCRNVGN
jgi:hypothetical protein